MSDILILNIKPTSNSDTFIRLFKVLLLQITLAKVSILKVQSWRCCMLSLRQKTDIGQTY